MDFHFCKWICEETNLCGQKYKSETGQIQICVDRNTNTKRDRNTNPKRPHQCILSTTAAATSTCSGYLDSTICLSDCLGWRKLNIWIYWLSSTSPTCWEAPFVLTDFPDVFFIFVTLIFVMKHSRQLTNTKTKM